MDKKNSRSKWTAEQVLRDTDVRGYTVIVTGSSSGVGVEIASAFAAAGANVTLAVRNVDAGRHVAAEIAARHRVRLPAVEHIDLLSMQSVREFADRWSDKPLNILVNNAGLMGPPLEYTKEGFESQMAVNYFAPFLLSECLLSALRRGAPARVVTVSSGSHHDAQLRLDDLHYRERPYDKFEAYGHAKLCANLLAVEYSRRHESDGVTMNVVTPGGVVTNLGRFVTFEDSVAMGWVNADGSLPQGEMKTPEQGAASPVWTAVAPELNKLGGIYVEDCAIAPLWQPATPKGWAVTAESLDKTAARTLWQLAAPLLGLPVSEVGA